MKEMQTMNAGQQDKEMTPSSRGVLKTISENAGTPGVVVGKMRENADTPAVVVDNMHENAGTQALFADMAHDDVTLDHEGTVKGQEDKLEEVVASLNTCFGSDSKKVLVVVKKEELQHRENSVEAFLANFTEVQEGGKEVDIELIFLLEEKQEKFSRKIVKLERSLKARQQLLDHVSMQLMNDNTNSVDKVVDKDPKNKHADTTKGQEDKQEEFAASLNYCFGSGCKKVFVVEKEVLWSQCNDFEAQLAEAIKNLEEGKALDIESIWILEGKVKNVSEEIEKLNRTLAKRQQLLVFSMRLLNELKEVAANDAENAPFPIGKVIGRMNQG